MEGEPSSPAPPDDALALPLLPPPPAFRGKRLRVASLFAGCGALDWGLHRTGHEIVIQCECDPGAQQVLATHFPGVTLAPDIRFLDRLPDGIDLVAAGFPCIDVSRAGLRAGLEGRSSGLIKHVFRLLRDALAHGRGVEWVLLENVEALLDRGRGPAGGAATAPASADAPPSVAWIVEQFEEIGYNSWAQRVVNAAAFGLPHRRRRVFILASLHGDARDVLLAQGRDPCPGVCARVAGGACFACARPGEAGGGPLSIAIDLGNAQSQPGMGVVPTLKTTNVSFALLTADGRAGRLPVEGAEALQGLPPGWTEPAWPPPGPGGAPPPPRERPRARAAAAAAAAAAGAAANPAAPPPPDPAAAAAAAARYARWALCGNAVSVPVAEWLGARLATPALFKYLAGPRDAPLRVAGVADCPHNAAPPPDDADARGGVDTPGLDGCAYAAATGREAVGQRCLGGAIFDEAAGGRAGARRSLARAPPRALRRTGVAAAAAAPRPPPPLPTLTVAEFQAAATTRAGAAALRPPGARRAPPPRPRPLGRGAPPGVAAAWPRAAWFVAGRGRFAAAVSDAPVTRALLPLHEFIPGPLEPLPDGAIPTYAARMREQGWDVSRVLAAAAACGVALPQGVAPADVEAGRLPGSRRPGVVGDVVWARVEGEEGAWWPAEALDPFDLPAGRTIPPGLAAALSDGDAAASLPGRAPPGCVRPPRPRYGGGGGRGAATPAAQARAAAAAAAAASSSSSSLPVRRVLAVFIGGGGPTHHPRWLPPAALLPWAARRADAADGVTADDALYYARAVTEAAAIVQAKAELAAAAAAGGAAGAAAPAPAAAAAVRTAAAAAAARAFEARAAARCGRCAACTGAAGRDRRCLVARAAAGAEAGHVGAQVAALGHGALGARVRVWWSGDGEWFAAVVVAFDEGRQRHTLAYDDAYVETVPLWSPSILVALASNPLDWPANAVLVVAEREAALASAAGEVEAARAAAAAVTRAARAGAGAGGADPAAAAAAAAAAGATPAPMAAALAALAHRGGRIRARAPPPAASAPPAAGAATWRGGGPSLNGGRCPSCSILHRGGCGTARAQHWCERRRGGAAGPRAARSPPPPHGDNDDSGGDDDAVVAAAVAAAAAPKAEVTTRSGRTATQFRFGGAARGGGPAAVAAAPAAAEHAAAVAPTEPSPVDPAAPAPASAHPAAAPAPPSPAVAPPLPPFARLRAAPPPRRRPARCATCVAAKKGRCGAPDCYGRCERRGEAAAAAAAAAAAPPPPPPPADDAAAAAVAPPPPPADDVATAAAAVVTALVGQAAPEEAAPPADDGAADGAAADGAAAADDADAVPAPAKRARVEGGDTSGSAQSTAEEADAMAEDE